LQLQSDTARTAKERRKLELEILAATQKRAREELEERIRQDKERQGGPTFDHDQARDQLERVQAAQRDRVKRDTQGPLERWREGTIKTTEEMNEALEEVAVKGLEGLEDGLLDVITGTKDAGEAFRDLANSIIRDLARIAIQQAIMKPIGDWLSSATGSGGFDLSNLFKSGSGGSTNYFDTSSFMSLDGGGYTGNGARSGGLDGKGGFLAVMHPKEIVTDLTRGMPSARAMRSANQVIYSPTFNLRGAVMTQDLLDQMNAIGKKAALMGAQGGAQLAGVKQASRERRTLR
jgi:hypothetical protein